MHDDQRPYESATDLFCIEPRQDDQPDERATYWAKLAGAALREAHDAKAESKRAEEVVYADAVRIGELEAERDALEDRLAMLHDVAVLAVDARHRGDTFNYGLQVGLLLNNLAPLAVRGVGSNGSPADDIALKAAAEALASFTTSDNAVCSDCDGSGRVVDGDDRLVRCPECGE